jgi:hypothetical protein
MQTTRRPLARTLILAGILAAPLAVQAQSAGIRNLSGFDSVQTSNGIDLNVTQGESFRVEVIASAANIPKILTEVEDHTLVIRLDRAGFSGFGLFGGAHVNVTMPAVRSLSASGGSDIRSENILTGDSLRVLASGGSDVSLDLAFESLEATVSGGSDMRLTGEVGNLSTQASGGSDLNGRALTAKNATIGSSGGSDTWITVTEVLAVTAAGGSDVAYFGSPGSVSVNASGGSDVIGRNESESALASGIRNLFGN